MGTIALLFKVIMLAPSSFLVALVSMLLIVHSLKDDLPSLRQDLGMYHKTGGIDPVEAAACLATCATQEVVVPCLLASFSSCCLGASSFVARGAFFATPLPVKEMVDSMVSLGAAPSSKNLAFTK